MSSITELINSLQDSASVLTSLPIKSGDATRLNCVYIKDQAPQFRLVFPPDALPTDQLDAQSQFKLSVKQENTSVTLNARIESIEDDRTLRVVATEPIDPKLLREYFRVTFRSPIKATYEPNPEETQSQAWKLYGETIDISGGGVLAIFPKEPQNRHNINLELLLPNKEEPMLCVAKIIRCRRLRKKRYRVAFEFDKIGNKTRDIIISFCLQEQRRQLRNKVRID